MSKKDALWEAVDHHKPDFIIGYETWLKPTITDNEILYQPVTRYITKTVLMATGVYIATHWYKE